MDILGTLKRLAGNRLTQKQKLVLRRIADLDSELTMSALIRQIAQEEQMGESTARVVIQALRDIGLIECGTEKNKGVPVCLTPIGQILVRNGNNGNLDELRGKIDIMDSLMLELISERLEVSKTIGKVKKKQKLGVRDSNREKIVTMQWRESAKARGLDQSLTRNLLRNLMAMSREVQ